MNVILKQFISLVSSLLHSHSSPLVKEFPFDLKQWQRRVWFGFCNILALALAWAFVYLHVSEYSSDLSIPR